MRVRSERSQQAVYARIWQALLFVASRCSIDALQTLVAEGLVFAASRCSIGALSNWTRYPTDSEAIHHQPGGGEKL